MTPLPKINIHINRNMIITYLICVIIASILWTLNMLNKDYTTEVTYPVKYINFPKGKHAVSELPKEMILEIKAKGFVILGYNIRKSFLPILFNVSVYSKHILEKNNVYEYILNTEDIKDNISSQLYAGTTIQHIRPDVIEFKLVRSASKKVAVSPVVNYTLKRQYILKNAITTSPDSILVSGPSAFLDTLSYIYTAPIHLKEIGKDVTKETELIKTSGINFNETSVEVHIAVEQFTEAQKSIPVNTLNLPDSINIKLFPNSIKVTYDIGLSRYDKISDSDFDFTVDYKQCALSSYLDVKIKKAPLFIKNITFTPHKIEYILEKRNK